ncbi:hypothetical protein PV325_009140 [Microctonus aethiopoides]|uniref:Large ribosomal subunit protein bL35m n=1 Tax=Microctonus aethiopoides TaxID=144406 RepID=A0AA39C825_9HYME|nr:hypothetical protein PV325_009140 [Microctonus aethiopoides]KAK0098711.1 hypothetical protein PV326_004865 [Microctonus aethiopoides]KAK0159304.1 hypothetical protein PV328_010196 [Microctonus aethiopoides]
MFSRILRSTIQNNIIHRNLCNVKLVNGTIIQKLQDEKQRNLISHWTSQVRWLNSTSTSSTVQTLTSKINSNTTLYSPPNASSILNLQNLNIGVNVPSRSVIKFTRSRGKRQTVKTVLRRFYRLNWGIWIRTKAGRHRRFWTKSPARKRRCRQHVFCNSTQSWLLDKMVSPYWRKPKYWVDDPYTPYHTREEFWITRKSPKEY